MTHRPGYAELLRLAALFKETEDAGFGIADGISFESFPGLEEAAAGFMEARVAELTASDPRSVPGPLTLPQVASILGLGVDDLEAFIAAELPAMLAEGVAHYDERGDVVIDGGAI